MKKLFAIIAFLGLFTLGISNAAMAQDEAAPQTEQAA
ncbi:MAG: MotA/TolQ/ExbB proton channel family protein, partial [Macellibacteroides fermentans]|nr:MotA/TolQ/ExbB proton channel family protein [Macellibacteroides fermentans]HAD02448.1 flagellar motor protein MotA [Porphyromonadaceae bacterium]